MNTVEQRMECLLENSEPDIQQINELIPRLKDELSIHAQLSLLALESAYTLIDKLNFSDCTKEHIIWFYYKYKLDNFQENHVEQLIEKIIVDFKKYKFSVLEYPLITLLKMDQVPEKFTQELNEVFANTEIPRYVTMLTLKKKIHNGYKLSKEDATRLLDLKAYDFLELALDENTIQEEVLTLIREPRPGEDSRKAKQRLYNKARIMKTIESKKLGGSV